MTLLCVLLFRFCQCIILAVGLLILVWQCPPEKFVYFIPDKSFKWLLDEWKSIEKDNEHEITNIYQAFGTKDFMKCVIVFLVQTMLMFYFVADLLQTVQTVDCGDKKVLKFWVRAIGIQFLMLASQEAGDKFRDEAPYWFYVMLHRNAGLSYTQPGSEPAACPGTAELVFRYFFSSIINWVFFELVVFLVPLQLMQSESGMDFVKDCLAIVFITALDDLNESVMMKTESNDPVEAPACDEGGHDVPSAAVPLRSGR
mmetsp:Transcript_183675/g.582649  ORF Transcript_183675/g.582649 Transcript_183675/m.582649 type:complete len:256 (-) Transcript_183675:94-861(-)